MAYNDNYQDNDSPPQRRRSVANSPPAGIASWNGMPSLTRTAQAAAPSSPVETSLASGGIASLPSNSSPRADFSDVRSSLATKGIASLPSTTWNPGVVNGLNYTPQSTYSGAMSDQDIARANGTPSQQPSVRNVNLPFGQIGKDGSLVLSDGRGIAGLPKTVSNDQLQSLANTNVVPSDAFRNPGMGTLGTPVSQNQGVMAAALNRGIAYYDPSAAARDYQSDVASIINKDPRSLSGTAAWNAYADSVWDRNTGNGAQGRANYLNGIGSLQGAAKGTFDAQNQAGNENTRDQTSYANEGLRSIASLSGVDLRGRYGEDVAQTKAGASNFAANQKADATRYAADVRANAPKVDGPTEAAYSRAYQSALKRGRNPDQAREEAGQFLQSLKQNRQSQYGGGGSSPSAPRIPQGAIDYLRSNPNLAEQFDAKYGNGAASQYLRNQ